MKIQKYPHVPHWLLWLTNNEDKPVKEWRKDEVEFDIIFFITLLISIILGLTCWIGGVIFKLKGLFIGNSVLSEIGSILIEGGWIFVGIIFFIEAWDSIRHNRDDE
jgi:hypothetical protein